MQQGLEEALHADERAAWHDQWWQWRRWRRHSAAAVLSGLPH